MPGPTAIADALTNPLLERAVSWLSIAITPRVAIIATLLPTAALFLLR